MQQWMRTRALRTVGLLFGLSLMLTACDVGDLLGLIGGGGAPEPPTAEEPDPVPEEVTDESEPDDVSDESEPEGDDVSDESEPEEEDGHDEERCRNRSHEHGRSSDAPGSRADEAPGSPDEADAEQTV